MTEEHKHTWSKNGCWCGAKQCVITEQPKPTAQNMKPKVQRCPNERVPGEFECAGHRDEKRQAQTGVDVA